MIDAILAPIAPLIVFYVAFLLTGVLLSRGKGIEKLKSFTTIFLSAPATLKTWALVFSGPALCLLLNGIFGKIGDNASWPQGTVIALARIQFYREVAIGLEVLLSIVLGALGAVTFKGQGPGGINFQLNQDGTASGTAPVPPPEKPKE